MNVLVYGYGNPGRLDDGLGPALVRELAGRGVEATLETAYQLQVEDAALVADHGVVVFADADAACAAPFSAIVSGSTRTPTSRREGGTLTK